MRKAAFALLFAAVACCCITSCSKDKAKCYKLKYKMGDKEVSTYFWATSLAMENEVERLSKIEGYTDVKVSAASKYRTPEDCWAMGTVEE